MNFRFYCKHCCFKHKLFIFFRDFCESFRCEIFFPNADRSKQNLKKNCQNFKMKIIISIPKEENLEITCRQTDPVIQLKTQIFESRGLFSNFYRLSFNGHNLDDNFAMLQSYGIKNGSVIVLTHWNDLLNFSERKLFKLDPDKKFWFRTLKNCKLRRVNKSLQQQPCSSLFSITFYAKSFVTVCQFTYLSSSFTFLSSFTLRSATE